MKGYDTPEEAVDATVQYYGLEYLNNCVWCGDEFTTKDRKKEHCSETCSAADVEDEDW